MPLRWRVVCAHRGCTVRSRCGSGLSARCARQLVQRSLPGPAVANTLPPKVVTHFSNVKFQTDCVLRTLSLVHP